MPRSPNRGRSALTARTYTFRLRSGLTFSDGSPLDATDVRRSWLRILDPATHSTAPDVLSIIQGAERAARRWPGGRRRHRGARRAHA